MKLMKMLSLLAGVVFACHFSVAVAQPGVGTQLGTASGAMGQSSSPSSNRLQIKASSAGTQNASSGTKTFTLNMPSDTKTETLKVVLNGKDVTSKFSPSSCTGAMCETGALSSEDGLRTGKNVLYAVAKGEAGKAVSSRLRFAGEDAQPVKRSITGFISFSAQDAPVQALPTASSFLPPTISLSTINPFGGESGSPWLQLGTQTQLNAAANCNSGYSVTVLDRQTLVEEPTSPQCFTTGQALAGYLKGLASNELVIVGTIHGQNSDASCFQGYLDTSAIGGTAYNCAGNLDPLITGCKTSTSVSNDVPLSYIAIGAGGAAPGSAYENYQLQNERAIPDYSYFFSNAHGMLTEDANGNYNFQSSSAVEYAVSAGTDTASVTLTNTPIYPNTKVVYTPPSGTKGFWVLALNRGSLRALGEGSGTCQQSSNAPSGEINFVNCGVFYQTGPGVDAATLTANYQALAHTLTSEPIDRRSLIILTTVGTAGQGTIWDVANNNSQSVLGNGSWYDNGYLEVSAAFRSLGIPDGTTLSLGAANSAFTYVTAPGLGNALSGQSVLSTTAYAQQGQSGNVHGMLSRDLKGLYRPSHTDQIILGADGSDFTLGLVNSDTPVDWPELASQMPATDSFAGQKAAYAYLSWYLLNAWYVQSETGSTGVPAPYVYDIHYFFTGSLNTFLDYHTFDPGNAIFPGTPGFSGGWNHPCTSLSGTTCTWTSPLDGTVLTFTQNDFNAVRTQLHNEVVDLTNVLLYMVDGSTNMKDIIAAGNSNTALALLGATSTITANLNEPNIQQATVTVAPWNIVNMLSGALTTVAAIGTDGLVNPEDAEALNGLIDKTADVFNNAASVAGGLSSANPGPTSGLPSPDYKLATTVGQIAQADMQGGMLAGFDAMLDSITGDWAKLNEIGPLITDPNNKAFFFPNQVLQNAAITMMNQAAQRSLYFSMLPEFYRVHYWPEVYSQSPEQPDMGYTSNGDTGSCKAFYTDGYNPPPAFVSTWYPSVGGKLYDSWDTQPNYPFRWDSSPNPVDYYVLAEPFSGVGASDTSAHYMSTQLTSLLFGNAPGNLNIPLDEFFAHGGPMDWRLDGQSSSFVDLSYFANFQYNATGHTANNICSMAELGELGVGASPGGGGQIPGTTTTLNAPASSVLGESVPLQATVIAVPGSKPVPSGTVQFRDASTVLGTGTLDATGSASFTASGLGIGDHSLAAYFIANGTYEASNSAVNTLTVYANTPDMSLSLSASTLQVSYGSMSSAVKLQISSQSGMTGILNFSCTGLPVGMACNFNPAQANITAGGKASTSFTIASTATETSGMLWARGLGGLLLPFSLICLWRISNGRQRIQAFLSLLLLSAVTIGCAVGCGGGGSKPQTNQETGSKTILVTATDGSLTRTVPLVLNIQ
jgi:Bacterial Ig-like domain (group 3)